MGPPHGAGAIWPAPIRCRPRARPVTGAGGLRPAGHAWRCSGCSTNNAATVATAAGLESNRPSAARRAARPTQVCRAPARTPAPTARRRSNSCRTLTTLSTPSKSTMGVWSSRARPWTVSRALLRSEGLGHLPVAAAGCACIRRRFLCERPSPAPAIGFCAGPVALAAQRSRVGPAPLARHGRIQSFPTHCMASLEGDLACVEGAGCYCCMCPSRTRSI